MFLDQWHLKLARYYDLYTLTAGLYSGWCLAVAMNYVDDCRSICEPLIVIACLIIVSVVALGRLRHRGRSLQEGLELFWKLFLAAFVLLASLANLAYLVVLCIRLSEDFSDDDCSNSVIGTAITLCPIALFTIVFDFLLALGIVFRRAVFMKPPVCEFEPEDVPLIEYVRTSRGCAVPTILYRYEGAKITIMYSHGNAVDLGQMLKQGKLRGLRDELGVNVFGYDYPGYGYSVGPISEEDVYDALESCYYFLVKHKGINPGGIVLYGRSMGSAPTTHLAAKFGGQEGKIAGVILESGLLSIIRTIGLCKSKTRWFDMFPNCDKVAKITVPVFITHGRTDTVVPFWHAEELHRLITSRKEFQWIDSLGHNDMPDVWQYRDAPKEEKETDEEYEKKKGETRRCNELNKEHRHRLRTFLASLEIIQPKKSSSKTTTKKHKISPKKSVESIPRPSLVAIDSKQNEKEKEDIKMKGKSLRGGGSHNIINGVPSPSRRKEESQTREDESSSDEG